MFAKTAHIYTSLTNWFVLPPREATGEGERIRFHMSNRNWLQKATNCLSSQQGNYSFLAISVGLSDVTHLRTVKKTACWRYAQRTFCCAPSQKPGCDVCTTCAPSHYHSKCPLHLSDIVACCWLLGLPYTFSGSARWSWVHFPRSISFHPFATTSVLSGRPTQFTGTTDTHNFCFLLPLTFPPAPPSFWNSGFAPLLLSSIKRDGILDKRHVSQRFC